MPIARWAEHGSPNVRRSEAGATSVLKHGRYSEIEREVQEWFQEMSASMRQLAVSTRNKFLRHFYTHLAEQKPTPDALSRSRDAVMIDRMR